MNKKLKKEIEEIINREREANIKCCQAWTSNCVRKHELVRGETQRRSRHNRNLETFSFVLSGMVGFIVFAYAGSVIEGWFLPKLGYALFCGITGFVVSLLAFLAAGILLSKSTHQDDVEYYLFGDD